MMIVINNLMKITSIFLCLLLASATLTSTWGFEEEDNVIVLKEATFDQAIKKFEFILVEFYAPWCGHCKQLAPEYAAAAKTLKGFSNPVPLAKVDTTTNQALGTRLKITSYPTLKFYIKGEPVDYTGPRTQSDIVNWIKKKTNPPSFVLVDAAALDKFKADNQVVVAYFGEDNNSYQNFYKVAQALDGITFVHTFDESIRKQAGAGLVLYKQFDEGFNTYTGDYSVESIKKFVGDHRYPLVMPFDGEEAVQRIFNKEQPALILFTDNGKGADYQLFSEAAQSIKGQIITSHCTVTTGVGQKLADYVGVKPVDDPSVWIIHQKSGEFSKYRLSGAISRDSILRFFDDYKARRLERQFKTAEVPQNNNEPVKIGVGKNFNDLVINNDKHVLVEFYAPWCGHCKKLAPVYDETAKALQSNNKILLVKIDSTENEIPGINIQSFPTLKFYKAGRKSNPIEFTGDRTKEGIFKFLKEQIGADWTQDL